MREAIGDWVERGSRAARFAGNFFWQVRIEDGGRRQWVMGLTRRDVQVERVTHNVLDRFTA